MKEGDNDSTIFIGLYNTAATLPQNGVSRIVGDPVQYKIKPPYQLLFEFLAYVYLELQKGPHVAFKI